MLPENIFTNLPQLETERLILRRFTLNDARDVFDYASNPEIAKYVGWEHHKSIDDAIDFLNRVIPTYEDPKTKEWTWGVVLKANGKLIGACSLWGEPVHARAEVGYVIGRDYWGQGFASELTARLLHFAIHELRLPAVYGVFEQDNVVSRRLLEKLGFVFEESFQEQEVIAEIHKYVRKTGPPHVS